MFHQKISLTAFFLLILSGCSVFQTAKVGPVDDAKKRICLDSEGKGRFIFEGQKHIFSYQSEFLEDEAVWRVLIDFPVYGRESIELEWDSAAKKVSYDASYEQALLKNTQGLNPALLDAATQVWINFFEDMLASKGLISKDPGKQILWSSERKSLRGELFANGFPAEISFLNPVSGGHFGRFDFKINSQPKREQSGETFGMELIVRNCLENKQ